MLTKDDIERAIGDASQAYHDSEEMGSHALMTVAITAFFQSLAIDEDKAVEEMAIALGKWSYEEGDMYDGGLSEEEFIKAIMNNILIPRAKAALHASPYYKLVKMMGEV